MNEVINKWGSDLAQFLSAALGEFRTQATEQVEQFAVDCHPWNGAVVLAFLTASEVEESPFLAEVEEMAAWKFYNFASTLSCSRPELGLRMRELYEQAGDDRAKVAEQFFVACAAAVASKPVQDMLSTYKLSKNFKITVPHPDSGKEYYPPA
jgi:hypothetical protein